MTGGLRWTLAMAITCGWMLAATTARAQYWAYIAPGIDLVPVAADARLARAGDDPLVAAAEAACGLTLDGLFRADAGARRFFELGWVEAEDGYGTVLAEFDVIPTNEQADLDIDPVDYHFEGGEVLIGFGPDPEDEWGPYSVVSFFADDSRKQQLADDCGAFIPTDQAHFQHHLHDAINAS